ncbi:MAG: PstS family phosphate ABC transporter substrate-binding protein [Saprospiraceae bacterium]
MKKFLFAVSSVLALSAFYPAGLDIRIKGSDTVLPLSQKFAEVFIKKNPGARITVTGGGSGVGLAAFLEGTTDIAMSSRKIKVSEKLKMQEAGKNYKELIIANDALSVIVHPSNKVDRLTREQLEGIFTGKITNWKQLGGEDQKIIAYSRESSSGTYEFFKEHVMDNKNYAASVLNMPATGAIIQSVAQNKNAVGYVGLAYVDKNVKGVSVSYDQGKNYVKATIANARSNKYPVVRPLYYYYLTKDESKLKPFINFALSSEGQKLVTEIGYVSVSK